MNEITQSRNIDIITNEIVSYQKAIQAIVDLAKPLILEKSVEIGKRLIEAKDMVGHGNWENYCKTKLNYSQRQATNYINVYKTYNDEQIQFGKVANSQMYANLNFSQLVELTAVSDEVREDIVSENDMESTTIAELKKIIAEKTKIIEDKDSELSEKENIEKDRDRLQGLIQVKENAVNALEQQTKELQRQINDLEMQAQQVSVDELANIEQVKAEITGQMKKEFTEEKEKIVAGLKKKTENEVADIKQQLADIQNAKEKAEQELLKAQEQAKKTAEESEKLRKAATVINTAESDKIKEKFLDLQNTVNRICFLLVELKDKDQKSADMLKSALLNYADAFVKQINEI